jgi:hypothetical protein
VADPTQVRAAGVVTVGLVASHRAWRTEFARYVQDHITGLRVRVLRDPRAIDDTIDVVIIDDSSTFLNHESLRQLREAGVHVIGIYDPSEHQGQGQAYLNRLGIADVASAELLASQLVELIREVAKDVEDQPAEDVTPVPAPERLTPTQQRQSTPRPTDRGLIITVGGPAATAALETAVALATDLAESRGTALIVDVDETTPALAARLGYRLEPSVLDATERLYDGDGDLSAVTTQATQGSQGFVPMHVLAGIANPDDWSLFGRDRCVDLLRRASEQWDHVVALSGSRLQALPSGVDRYGSSRGAVASGDLVVGVCEPTPIGVLHGLDWLIDTRRLRHDAPVWIAFAGRPRSAVQRADLVEAMTREAGADLIAGVVFLPMGPEVERASWEGRVVTKSRFTKAVRTLVDELVPPTKNRSRRGRRADRSRSRS